jgi:vacuolar-type H+-ATPase catalytic subunit A/Vma1
MINNKLKNKKTILNNYQETGTVIYTGDGTATITGLSNVQAGELLLIQPNNVAGLALNLNTNSVDVVLFGDNRLVNCGNIVTRQNKLVSIPTGAQMLGRVVDALGNPLDNIKTVISETNVLPVGKGQRELIIDNHGYKKKKSYFLKNRNQESGFLLNTSIIKRNFSNMPTSKESSVQNINAEKVIIRDELPKYMQPIAPLPNSTIFSKVFSIFSTVLLFSLIRNEYINTAGAL